MPFSTRLVRQALTGKHGFVLDPGGHLAFTRSHNGQEIAWTHISHASGGKDISDWVLGKMAQQLRVSGPTLRGAISCSVSPQAFLLALLEGVDRAAHE